MYRELYDDIISNKMQPIYILHGVEKYLINSMIRLAKSKLLDEAVVDFNYLSCDGQGADFSEIMDICITLPVMDTRRIVVIENPIFLEKASWSDSQRKKFMAVFEDKTNPTILFLVCDTIDSRLSFVKDIKKVGKVVDFCKLERPELSKWIRQEFNKNGADIQDSAIAELVNLCGYFNNDMDVDLFSVLNIINKLSSKYLNSVIKTSDVQSELGSNIESNIFTMIDAIFDGNSELGYSHYEALKAKGEPEIKTLFMIHRHLRQLISIKDMRNNGLSEAEICKNLNLKSFIVSKALRQLSRFRDSDLLRMLDFCTKADNLVKLGSQNPDFVLLLVIGKISTYSAQSAYKI